MDRIFFMSGAVFGLAGVAIGAFGAHGLKKFFETAPELQTVFKTAAEYQMVHALALIGTAWAFTRWPGAAVQCAGGLFIAGIILFSGSLYALVLTRQKWLGAITPLGGLAFMAGWMCLIWGAWKGGR